MLIGGIVFFVLAVQTAPSEPHHGSPVDALDAFATLGALLEGGMGVVLLLSGGLLMRSTSRRTTTLPSPPPIALPTAQARNVPPSLADRARRRPGDKPPLPNASR